MNTDKKLILFFLPWVLIAPFILFFEIDKLDLPGTIKLAKAERSIHFLKIAMPGLQNDYFSLLIQAKSYLKMDSFYQIEINDQETPFVKLMTRYYSVFDLLPAKYSDKKKPSFKLYYRKKPEQKEGKILCVLKHTGKLNSYIIDSNKGCSAKDPLSDEIFNRNFKPFQKLNKIRNLYRGISINKLCMTFV